MEFAKEFFVFKFKGTYNLLREVYLWYFLFFGEGIHLLCMKRYSCTSAVVGISNTLLFHSDFISIEIGLVWLFDSETFLTLYLFVSKFFCWGFSDEDTTF